MRSKLQYLRSDPSTRDTNQFSHFPYGVVAFHWVEVSSGPVPRYSKQGFLTSIYLFLVRAFRCDADRFPVVMNADDRGSSPTITPDDSPNESKVVLGIKELVTVANVPVLA